MKGLQALRSQALPCSAPHRCSVLLAPSSWRVALGLSYASTAPRIYFHLLQWKFLCCKTIPAENKTFVNKNWNLPRGQFHWSTCKPVAVVDGLSALKPCHRHHPAAPGGGLCCHFSRRGTSAQPPQPGGLQGWSLVFSSSTARAASPEGLGVPGLYPR